MIDYRAGVWGFHVAIGWHGSLAPRALTMAIPNAILTFIVATLMQQPEPDDFNEDGTSNAFQTESVAKAAQTVIATFTIVMLFILYNRSRTSYNRWWEGGTLLQKTRGEWFNAFSSIMAFTSTKPELQEEVESYCHLLARLMSLLMCCGLQQVSPNRDRPFEIIDLAGIEPESMEFLNSAPDKVEVILQWIQRSMILHAQSGVLPVAPPILSRAFQEVSRGIVNLQNARKIADFPYPYPLAQVCMILQILHWVMTPVAGALALPRGWAVLSCFLLIFVLWCIHFNALDLEFPFGARVNDLPMDAFQQDWNKSVITLLDKRATRPPMFDYEPHVHNEVDVVMSDLSELYVPVNQSVRPVDKGVAIIRVADKKKSITNKHRRRRSLPVDGTRCGDVNVPRQSILPNRQSVARPSQSPGANSNKDAPSSPRLKDAPSSPRLKDAPSSPRLKDAPSSPRLRGGDAPSSPRLKDPPTRNADGSIPIRIGPLVKKQGPDISKKDGPDISGNKILETTPTSTSIPGNEISGATPTSSSHAATSSPNETSQKRPEPPKFEPPKESAAFGSQVSAAFASQAAAAFGSQASAAFAGQSTNAVAATKIGMPARKEGQDKGLHSGPQTPRNDAAVLAISTPGSSPQSTLPSSSPSPPLRNRIHGQLAKPPLPIEPLVLEKSDNSRASVIDLV